MKFSTAQLPDTADDYGWLTTPILDAPEALFDVMKDQKKLEAGAASVL
jgi:hypothetical protein